MVNVNVAARTAMFFFKKRCTIQNEICRAKIMPLCHAQHVAPPFQSAFKFSRRQSVKKKLMKKNVFSQVSRWFNQHRHTMFTPVCHCIFSRLSIHVRANNFESIRGLKSSFRVSRVKMMDSRRRPQLVITIMCSTIYGR